MDWEQQERPMFRAKNIVYELAERARGLAVGGIGLMFQLARRMGLVQALDERVHVLKRHCRTTSPTTS